MEECSAVNGFKPSFPLSALQSLDFGSPAYDEGKHIEARCRMIRKKEMRENRTAAFTQGNLDLKRVLDKDFRLRRNILGFLCKLFARKFSKV